MEYIERKAAIDAMTADNLLKHFDSVEDVIEKRFHRAAERILAKIPAADVVEVRHGHWEFEDDENMLWCTKAICTSCKQVVADNTDLTQKWGKGLFSRDNLYCPRCGAKMDGGLEPPKEEA